MGTGRSSLAHGAAIIAPFSHRVAFNDCEEFGSVHKFGAIASVGTSLTPCTTAGVYPTPTTPVSLEAVAGAADVHTTGAGAWTLQVQGLGADWREQSEDIQLNGATPVALTKTWLRVFRMKIIEGGSYTDSTTPTHVGAIEVRVAGAGATWGIIDADAGFGMGQSQIGVYTIPKDKRGFLLGHHITIEGTKAADIFLFSRANADTIAAPFAPMQVKELNRGIGDSFNDLLPIPRGPFVGPCDIGYMVRSTGGTVSVTVDYNILLEDDDH